MVNVGSSLTDSSSRVSWKLWAIGLLILILDQLSKAWVTLSLPDVHSFSYSYPYGGIGVFRNFLGIEFSINHMTNTGAAWGVLGNYQVPLIIMRISLIFALVLYLACFNSRLSWKLPLVIVIAGACGNVLDFFIYGHVVDMLHFVLWGYEFPVFNLADTSITLGIASLFVLSWLHDSH